MPMQRWIASAAGGTSQRLNPAVATIRSRSNTPKDGPDTAPVALMLISSGSARCWVGRAGSCCIAIT